MQSRRRAATEVMLVLFFQTHKFTTTYAEPKPYQERIVAAAMELSYCRPRSRGNFQYSRVVKLEREIVNMDVDMSSNSSPPAPEGGWYPPSP